jgi:hypothetical protein
LEFWSILVRVQVKVNQLIYKYMIWAMMNWVVHMWIDYLVKIMKFVLLSDPKPWYLQKGKDAQEKSKSQR